MNKLRKTHDLFNKHVWIEQSSFGFATIYKCTCGLYKVFNNQYISNSKRLIKQLKAKRLIPKHVKNDHIIVEDLAVLYTMDYNN